MREIKFRVWDKHDHEMVEVRQLNWEPEMNISIIGCWHEDASRFHLMQYTGLKDKNRMEIYEGDILKHIRTGFAIEVIFEEGVFLGRFIEYPKNKQILMSKAHHAKIIGNIHENPDLLEAP